MKAAIAELSSQCYKSKASCIFPFSVGTVGIHSMNLFGGGPHRARDQDFPGLALQEASGGVGSQERSNRLPTGPMDLNQGLS